MNYDRYMEDIMGNKSFDNFLLERFASKHRICFVLLFIILDQLLLNIRVWGIKRMNLTGDILDILRGFRIETAFNVIFGMIFILAIYLLGDIKEVGLFNKKGFLRGLLLGFPMLFLVIYYLIGYYNVWDYRIYSFEIKGIFILILHVFSISFFEEIEFRAVLYLGILKHGHGIKKRKNMVIAAIISSILFGVGHIGNGFENHIQAILFVINATILGLFWSSIFIKVKNIWSVIFLHALADFFVGLPCIIFPTSFVRYITEGVVLSVNKFLDISLESTDGITQYFILNIFCVPIFFATITYLKHFKKNEEYPLLNK